MFLQDPEAEQAEHAMMPHSCYPEKEKQDESVTALNLQGSQLSDHQNKDGVKKETV